MIPFPIPNFEVPRALRGPYPADSLGSPRYCGTIYVDVLQGHLAESTRELTVAAIQDLYRVAESQIRAIDLDEVLISGRMDELEAVLTGCLVRLRNNSRPGSIAAERKWKRCLRFVTTILLHVGADLPREHLRARMLRLEGLYSQLSPVRTRGASAIRALPALVVEELYEILSPHSALNPYRLEGHRWRNFLMFLLLLHLGVRAGELLALRVESLRSEFDPKSGANIFWLDIADGDDPADRRVRKPRLKNTAAVRQLPVSTEIASLIDAYVANWRGDRAHGLLFGSAEGRPLAVSSLALVLHRAGAQLTLTAQTPLAARGQRSVRPHDLRHTSAVVRLQRFREAGVPQDEALERLRPFFGWRPGSTMPLLYARAYFEPRFQDTWDENFSDALSALRALGGHDAQ